MFRGVPQSWVFPKAIAVATDLTDLEFLLPHAKAQARASEALLWFIHVIPPEVYVSPSSGAYPFVPKEKAYRDAEGALLEIARQLEHEGFRSKYEIRRWSQVEQIAAFVRQKSIDRLIIGTSGKSKLGKLLLGSVAEELMRTVDIPVCTVGPHVGPRQARSAHNMLYATSLRHTPEASLQFAVHLAAVSQAHLTVLHVLEPSQVESSESREAQGKLSNLIKEADARDIGPVPLLRFGDASEEILNAAAELKAGLLVLGAVSASNLAAFVSTGVAYKVITKAPCPVLTLRESHCAKCSVRESMGASIESPGGIRHADA